MPPARPPSSPGVLVVTPTYNELESLEATVAAVRAAVPAADILIVDDGSPDGTGELADRLADADPQLSVLHRAHKDGLGRAYVASFGYALEHGYQVVVQLDADGSHPASALPGLLAALETDADSAVGLVIGSRWVDGGRVVDWPASRSLLSRGGNWYARTLLGIRVLDITAGYRVWRADALRDISLDELESRGYCFQIDMTRRAVDAGWGVVELPITFTERQAGHSKMSRSIVLEAMWRVTVWGLARPFTRSARRRAAQRNAERRVSSGQPDSAPFVDIRQQVPPGGAR